MSLRKLLPSSGAIFMFEAAARHMSFTAAASEFNVTQSAISRMIGLLEKHIGVRLLVRHPTGIELTDEGRILYRGVGNGFQQVEMALDELRERNGQRGIVTISVSSALAMHWFMPRFDFFRMEFPEIDLRFQLVHGEPRGPFDAVDFGIDFNPLSSPAFQSWKLIDEIVAPVCSPSYLASHGGIDGCPNLSHHTFAHLTGALRIPWHLFLAETGYPDLSGAKNMFFSDYALLIQATIKGQGIGLGWWHVVANELLHNGLALAGSKYLRTGHSYYLVATSCRPMRKPAAIVREWLICQMMELSKQIA